MTVHHQITSLWRHLLDWRMPQIRAFHMAWLAFFLCFFAWFGIAPLMPVVREELALSDEQVGWSIIASVAITFLARLLVGWLCDRIGPRLAYTWLLVLGSLPVMGMGLVQDFTTFLIIRLLTGVIGASFVITQYHTSMMFAANCVGTANATSAGWGNMGGGATQLFMPLIFTGMVGGLGMSEAVGWRASMVLAGLFCLLTGIAYCLLTQDTPEGNFRALRRDGRLPAVRQANSGFLTACRDYRVWILFVIYGACFGIELTINNVVALYFLDYFAYFQDLNAMEAMRKAGLIASLFGLMNLFARTLGGVLGDQFGGRWGLRGRVFWLFAALFCAGLTLMLFAQMRSLAWAIPILVLFSLFVQMAEGATFSVVPFVNKRALGAVAGIVGAGGNAGAVLAGFLLKSSLSWPTALLLLGGAVTACSFGAFLIRFSPAAEREAQRDYAAALRRRRATVSTDLEPSLITG